MTNKSIQNYILQTLDLTTPAGFEIWSAKHKVLNKNFTLKKVKLPAQSFNKNSSRQHKEGKLSWLLNNLLREVDLLKRQNLELIPRCHKIIKSSTAFYVVYDQFLGTRLKDYLTLIRPSCLQKLQILLEIAKKLQKIHALGIVLLTLSTLTIYVSKQGEYFFSDWSFAVQAENFIFQGYDYLSEWSQISPEVRQSGNFSFASDIFAIGKVFEAIWESEKSSKENNIAQFLMRMVKSNPIFRPKIAEVVRQLKKAIVQNQETKDSKREEVLQYKQRNSDKRLSTQTTVQDDLSNKSQKMLSLNKTFNSERKITNKIPIKQHNRIKLNRRQNSLNVQDMQMIAMQICKRRNLTFFILSMVQFVMEKDRFIELTFMLCKYGRLNMQDLIKIVKEDVEYNNNLASIVSLLHEQYERILSMQRILRRRCQIEQCNKQLSDELTNRSSIKDVFMNSKLIQFGEEMLSISQCNKQNSKQVINHNLLFTLLMLRKVQCGSYEAFWQKKYMIEKININSQSIMKQELKLGQRYLRRKITQIIKQYNLK